MSAKDRTVQESLPLVVLTPEQSNRMLPFLDRMFGSSEVLDARVLSDDQIVGQLRALARRVGIVTRDSMTGLADRRHGIGQLELLLPWTEEQEPLAVVLLDLDHFKHVNELWGHSVGDQVLGGVGGLLQVPREGCLLASRFGGEEFQVIIQGARSQTHQVVEQLKDSFTTLRLPDGSGVTASFGIAFARPAESAEDLLTRADQNLYEAKRQGRNRIVSEPPVGDSLSDFELELRDYENRVRVFADRMVTVLTSRGRKMALSLRDEADLDDFCAVNRDHGYPAADTALREAAQTLKTSIRVTDWAARYGGEELCGIFPDASIDHLIQRAGLAVRVSKASGKNRVTVA